MLAVVLALEAFAPEGNFFPDPGVAVKGVPWFAFIFGVHLGSRGVSPPETVRQVHSFVLLLFGFP